MDDHPPPAYEEATASSKPSNASPSGPINSSSNTSSRLNLPRNGIPPTDRRSMEDEGRPLPQGWVRQFDAKEAHQFFVDTQAKPPRSIWHHPYDDEEYLSTLSVEEREKIEAEENGKAGMRAGKIAGPSLADIAAESSADDSDYEHSHLPSGKYPTSKPQARPPTSDPSSGAASLPPRPNQATPAQNPKGLHKLGRRFKDNLLGSTHAEREAERARRAEEERDAYARYMHLRSAMVRANETGQPQLLGKDDSGRDVYMEPPRDEYGPGGYGGGYGGRMGPAGPQNYNPYTQGPYANPENRFVAYPRPNNPYGRPGGYGYGGGMGLPIAGGLLGGLALGSLLF